MIDAPCKGCEDRHEACHGDCERYLTYQKEHRKIQAAIKAENFKAGVTIQSIERMKCTGNHHRKNLYGFSYHKKKKR